MAKIEQIMQIPITVTNNHSILQAISTLLEKKISRLIVIESESSIGIVTAKDIGLFLLHDESEKSLDYISISEIIKPLITVEKHTSVQKCAQIMVEKEIGSLGIVSSGNLIGIITKTDLVKYYQQNYTGKNKVSDFMQGSFFSMDSDENLYNIISKMLKEKISRIFLTQKDFEIDGILTFRDLFPLAVEKGHLNTLKYNDFPETSIFHMGEGFGFTTFAKDIMNKKVVSIDQNEDLSSACKKMIENRISGVGVKEEKKTVGIISKTDIVKALSKTND